MKNIIVLLIILNCVNIAATSDTKTPRTKPLCTETLYTVFKTSFYINVLTDNNFKQKALGNLLGGAYIWSRANCSPKTRSCQQLQGLSYLGGFITGSIVRMTLNEALIPWAIHTYKKSLLRLY